MRLAPVLAYGLATSGLILAATSAHAQASQTETSKTMTEWTVTETAAALERGATTSVALTETYLKAAEARKSLNAYITVDRDGALAAAAESDARRKSGKTLGPLDGVPIALKDNIATKGVRTTAGSPGLEVFVPSDDATIVKRLRAAGAVILGKANMHELAAGITSNNAAYGAVGSAYSPQHSAGGSSGGSGALVGARMAPAAIGTDTGGSVRIPAAHNGIIGFRPTVSRYPGNGIVPISTTRDTAGPLARSMADIILLDAIMAADPTPIAARDVKALRLGVADVFDTDLDPEVARLYMAALDKLHAAGATIVRIDLPTLRDTNMKAGMPIARFEARRDLARFLNDWKAGVDLEGVYAKIASPDVKGFSSGSIPQADYDEGLNIQRPRLQALYADAFAQHRLDALVFPTTPLPAPPISGADMEVTLNGRKVPTFPTYIRNTDPGSVAALPGLSMPIGLTKEGLPVGIEFDAPTFADRHLLAIGLAVEPVFGALPPPKP